MRVELCQVTKRYGELVALAGVDLSLYAGERVALIGPNGSGKTTLTRIVLGLVGHEGQVRLDGQPAERVRRERGHELARKAGLRDTPGYLVDGKKVPVDELEQALE